MMSAAHTTRAHARLSPSAAKRWMACPGSVREEAKFPDSSSSFADEGTAAHELAQHCLEKSADADAYEGFFVNLTESKPINAKPLGERSVRIDAEMVDGVQVYLDHVRGIMSSATEWEVEKRVDLTSVPGMEGGTADFLAYDEKTGVLHVVDLKYGRGVAVEVEGNPQLFCYGLGALTLYGNRRVMELQLHIVQPRASHRDGPVRTWTADPLDLHLFRTDLRLAAERTAEPDAPLAAGDWCKFCKAAPACETLRSRALSVAQAEFGEVGDAVRLPDLAVMTQDRLGALLEEITLVSDWTKRVLDFAHQEASHGRVPTGFKMVAKRATRKWRSDEDVLPALRALAGVRQSELFTEPELKSPAQVEAVMPGKNKEERKKAIANLVVSESSGTVLAPLDDKRPAVRPDAATEFEAV